MSTNTEKSSTFSWGTALLITAAFIGPGTVLTASKAGASMGYELLWAVVFSVIATCTLQVMAAKLGLVTGSGINNAIRQSIPNPFLRWLALGLVLLAILYGNSAYQTGNLLGARSGLEIITGWDSAEIKPWLLSLFGIIAVAFVWCGGLNLVQKMLMALVTVMSFLFVAAAVGGNPDPSRMAAGLVPSIPDSDSFLFIVGLIGTTVVPYNLFLHAGAVAEHRRPFSSDNELQNQEITKSLRSAVWDTVLSVSVGGLVTAAILVAAAIAFADSTSPLNSTNEVAIQLRPTIGAWAESVFALGLIAAGLTSSITAPIAAGYCAAGCFQWPMKLADWRVRTVATIVIVIGVAAGWSFGKSPMQTIILAQVANGLVLPLIAMFLIFACNQKSILGPHTNRTATNVLAGGVVIVTLLIASRWLWLAWLEISKLS